MDCEAMVRRLGVQCSGQPLSNYYHFNCSVENELERTTDKEREPGSKILQ